MSTKQEHVGELCTNAYMYTGASAVALTEHDVVGRQVSVHNVLLFMQVSQRQHQLYEDVPDALLLKIRLLLQERLAAISKWSSLNQLHHNVQLVV